MQIELAAVSTKQVLFGLCAVVVASALVLGGGARAGYLSDTILQALAIPLLLVALWRLVDVPLSRHARWALVFCLALVALPLLQLVPLPPATWTALPHREAVATHYHLLGRELVWMPISLAPHWTWLSALSLLLPLAVFVGTLQLDYQQRRHLSLVILAVGLASVFLGLAQVSQGSSGFFDFMNPGDAIGFFANRNHFAALIYCLTLLAAAWATHTAFSVQARPGRKGYDTRALMAVVASFTVLVVLVAAQAMARSRAGLFLTIIALLGALALAFVDRRSASGLTPTRLVLAATAVAVIFALQFALYRVMERFALDPLQDARLTIARTTIEAAKAFMPVGSGIGSFVPVYASFERPDDLLPNFFANRAHNEPLEVWLEAGVLGLALMGTFAVWLTSRSVRLWQRSPAGARDIDVSLARAGTLIIALLIAHSFVDYPLRTAAIEAIMAFACALLIEPAVSSHGEAPVAAEGAREAFQDAEVSRQQVYEQQLGPVWPSLDQQEPGERWGQDIEWPEEWRKPTKPRGPGSGGK